ncbi:MAG: hypothetical protein ACKV22_01700, partial [Bryobacteraceae bacterium]
NLLELVSEVGLREEVSPLIENSQTNSWRTGSRRGRGVRESPPIGQGATNPPATRCCADWDLPFSPFCVFTCARGSKESRSVVRGK